MNDLREYLKTVLAYLNLVKLLDLNPTPQDVQEIQDIDWLITETQERIDNEDDFCSEEMK